MPVLEVEVHLEDIKTRLDKKVAKYAAKIYTLESTYPIRRAISYRKGQRRLRSPLYIIVREHVDRIKPYRGITL